MEGPNWFCTDGIARQTVQRGITLGNKECLYAFEFIKGWFARVLEYESWTVFARGIWTKLLTTLYIMVNSQFPKQPLLNQLYKPKAYKRQFTVSRPSLYGKRPAPSNMQANRTIVKFRPVTNRSSYLYTQFLVKKWLILQLGQRKHSFVDDFFPTNH